jgi:hypothetical protein
MTLRIQFVFHSIRYKILSLIFSTCDCDEEFNLNTKNHQKIIFPIADTYADPQLPTKNFGQSNLHVYYYLLCYDDWEKISCLTFDLTGIQIDSTIQKVILKLYCSPRDMISTNVTIYRCYDPSWGWGLLNWTNKPTSKLNLRVTDKSHRDILRCSRHNH